MYFSASSRKTLIICLMMMTLIPSTTLAWVETILTPSGSIGGYSFGYSVAIDGDYAVVGDYSERSDMGTAYIFHKANGSWIQQARLVASDSLAGDNFGTSVDISGDYVVIGSPWDDDSGSSSGSAYVFQRVNATWTQLTKLTADTANAGDNFGHTVTIDGDVVAVGSPYDDDNGSASGSVYIFTNSGGNWSLSQQLVASDASAGYAFGYATALSGNYLYVGSPYQTSLGISAGAAYAFFYNGSSWSQQALITAPDGATDDSFGHSVNTDGNKVVIGAPWDDDAGSGSGSAYVFGRSETSWLYESKITASNAGSSDLFGRAVAISGNDLLIGAEQHDNSTGAAYQYHWDGATWIETNEIHQSNPVANDRFGSAVAFSGNEMIIGAYGEGDEGTAHLINFRPEAPENLILTAGDLSVTLTWEANSESDISHYKIYGGTTPNPTTLAATNSGGVNDTTVTLSGLTDNTSHYFYVTAVDGHGGESFHSEGTMIAFGSNEFKLGLATGEASDLFGRAVSIDGDYAAVGNSYDDSNDPRSGSVDIFRKVGDSWSFQTNLMPDISYRGMQFGVSVSLSGNYLLIGSLDNAGGTNSGAAFVFYRDGENWQQQAKLTPSDPAPHDFFGLSVAIDGDYAIVGSSYDDTWSTDAGSAYIFHRTGAAWSQTQKLLGSDGDYADHFGESVDISGNSIIVGASNNDQGADGSGAAFIFGFDGSSWSEESKIVPGDPTASKFFGKAVSIHGDYAAAGATWDAEHDTQAGAAYIFHRSGGNWSQQAKLFASNYVRVDQFGTSVSISDTDLIVGAPYHNDTYASNSGCAYQFIRMGDRWVENLIYTDENGDNDHNYGWALDLDEKTAIIGAPGADDGGAAFIRTLPPDTPAYLVLTPGDGQVTLTWDAVNDNSILGYSVYGGNQPHPNSIVASNYSGVSDTTVILSGLSDTSNYYYYIKSRNLNGNESSGSEAVMISFGLRENKITAANLIDADNYGGKVALSNDYAVVAASSRDEYGENSGQVFVYHRTEYGWYQKAKLKANDASSGDYFGSSVALSGDYILIGAKEADGIGVGTGAAYIFYYSGQNWQQQAKLTALDGGSLDHFGVSVDIDGDYVIIGAEGDDDGLNAAGAAYIFAKIDTAWTQQAKLLAGDAEMRDYFGNAVAIDGDYALIGAYGETGYAGAAYVFMRAGGAWGQQAKLSASDAYTRDKFGTSVALDGNYALIGADQDDDYGTRSGSAYIFQRNGTSWDQQGKLTAGDAEAYDYFGISVAILDDQVLIGAYQEDTPASNCGAMYQYGWNGSKWVEQSKFARSDAPTGSFMGYSVALSPKYMMGGAYSDESAYIIDLPPFAPTGLTLTPGTQQVTLDWDSNDESDFSSYRIFGDTLANPTMLLNTITDRLDTSVVIANLDENQNYFFCITATDVSGQSSGYSESQVVAFGPRSFTLAEPEGDEVSALFGFSPSVDGDYAIVGAWGDDEAGSNVGAAHIYKKINSTWVHHAKLLAGDGASTDFFGQSVAIYGNYAVVGAANDDDAGTSSGSAYVFHRTESGWSEQAKLTASDAAAGHSFGKKVTIYGDYIGIGASGSAANSVYVFVRSDTVWTEQQKLSGGYNHTNGGSRIVIGSQSYNGHGGAFVFDRSGTAWTQTVILEASDTQSGDSFGQSISLDGDYLAVGAVGDDDLADGSGAVYVFELSDTSWVERAKLLVSDGGSSDYFGRSVALEGDNLIASGSNGCLIQHFARSGLEWNIQTTLPTGDYVDIADGYAVYENNYAVYLQKLPLKAPANLVATPGESEVSLSWSPSAHSDFSEYRIYGGTSPDPTTLIGTNSDNSSNTTFTAAGLSENTSYFYRITTVDVTGVESAYSSNVLVALGPDEFKLTSIDIAEGDEFGWSIDVDGDYAIVGAPKDDDRYESSGSAYIFKRTGSAWTQSCKLNAGDPGSSDNFGWSVSIDGDIAVVGAQNDHFDGMYQVGSIYVFKRSGEDWTQEARLLASDYSGGSYFGFDVSLHGDYIIVGAYRNANSNGSDAGAAYIFYYDGSTWSEQTKLIVPDGGNDYFGYSVDINATHAITGAYLADDTYNDDGAAYIFERSGTSWTLQSILHGHYGSGDHFGASVSLSGDRAIVNQGYNAGRAYIFELEGSNWIEKKEWVTYWNGFAWKSDIRGDYAIINQVQNSENATAAGAAYVFVKTSVGWQEAQKFLASDGAEWDRFGHDVELSDDYAAVTTPYSNSSSGAVYIYDLEPLPPANLTANIGLNQLTLNWSPCEAADFSEYQVYGGTTPAPTALIATHSGSKNDTTLNLTGLDEDAHYFYQIRAVDENDNQSLFSSATAASFNDPRTSLIGADIAGEDRFGTGVSIDGDYAIVGSNWDDDAGSRSGSAYIFKKYADGWVQQTKLIAADAKAVDYFGCAVDISGDYAIVGAYQDDDGASNSGSAYIFKRSGQRWLQQAKIVANSPIENEWFGYSVAIDGDYAVAGGRNAYGNVAYSGAAWTFHRDNNTWIQQTKLIASDGAYGDAFGESVDISGDYCLIGGSNARAAYMFIRNGSAWDYQTKITSSASYPYQFGRTVSIQGDYALIGAMS
ncbi:MAG: fibronectin type III domain-containing protein, partial [Candidatus Marinimicrobia bacterium]|nr:fibronectin type III domain-containing protein [Candidatus Neomarinimicrobiota bacterium]